MQNLLTPIDPNGEQPDIEGNKTFFADKYNALSFEEQPDIEGKARFLYRKLFIGGIGEHLEMGLMKLR